MRHARKTHAAERPDAPTFAALLAEAVDKPGIVSEAYSAFHAYSLGNQIAAAYQCARRGMPVGPLATFPGWKERGRSVRKGEHALVLCQPVTAKWTEHDDDTGEDVEHVRTRFAWRAAWFTVYQTDGAEYVPDPPRGWDKTRALAALGIAEEVYSLADGNTQGYAHDRCIAVSPVAVLPYKTAIHEIAHVMLGHTAEGTLQDDDATPRNLREVEAEAVAYILTCVLDMPGRDESRGYVQHWLGRDSIPERSAQRIYTTANAILTAGQD